MKPPARAFTLIELLVVIGILAVLIGVLLPALRLVRDASRATACQAKLSEIGRATHLYTNDWRGVMPVGNATGTTWWKSTAPTGMASPSSPSSYWGIALMPYLSSQAVRQPQGDQQLVIDAATKIFLCPSSRRVNSSGAATNFGVLWPTSYGLNQWVFCRNTLTVRPRRIANIPRAAETILCHDSYKAYLMGPNNFMAPSEAGDRLTAAGGTRNLVDMRPGGVFDTAQSGQPLSEYYRHRNKCQVLWMDGHVSAIPYSDGTDVPGEWYWGVNKILTY